MPSVLRVLEIKRTSITRLKRVYQKIFRCTLKTWNQKNLDYEIETMIYDEWHKEIYDTWNQKNLDYEIETSVNRR